MAELITKEDLNHAPVYSTLTEIGMDPKDAYILGYKDFNFFTSLAIPDVFKYQWPEFYILLHALLTSDEQLDPDQLIRFALGLPRGHAKTTFVKVLIAWLLAYDKTSFVLVLAASDPLASSIVEDVSDILGSPNMEVIFGKWHDNLTKDTIGWKQAMYHKRPIILLAKGAESSFRGVNIKFRRPDIIFCDDVQSRENDKSEAERGALLDWLTATAFKTIAVSGRRRIIFLGNMYSESCILMQLKNSPYWLSLITGAILENRQPLWPELHSLESLMESYFHDEALNLGDIWFAEVMNDPISAAQSLLPAGLVFEDLDLETIKPDSAFLTIDPAGFKSTSDDNVIAVHYVYDTKGHIVEYDIGIKNPEELIIKALQLCIIHGCCLIGVEDVGYQQTLQFWLEKYIEDWEMQDIVVVPMNPHGRSKEARIRQFVEELASGNYNLATPSVRNSFLWQARAYRLGFKKNRDDILDGSAYGLDIRNEYWHLLTSHKERRIAALPARVRSSNTPF